MVIKKLNQVESAHKIMQVGIEIACVPTIKLVYLPQKQWNIPHKSFYTYGIKLLNNYTHSHNETQEVVVGMLSLNFFICFYHRY